MSIQNYLFRVRISQNAIQHPKLTSYYSMAAFFINTCNFSDCNLTFSSLTELIQHVESSHIETDPDFLEQQENEHPTYVPLSYILRHNRSTSNKSDIKTGYDNQLSPIRSEIEIDPIDTDSSSIDSWASDNTKTQIIGGLPLNKRIRRQQSNILDMSSRPYVCQVIGCGKRYKNVNGIKYHLKNGHKNLSDSLIKTFRNSEYLYHNMVRTPTFVCPCGKSFKTHAGLRNHTLSQHPCAGPSVENVFDHFDSKPTSFKGKFEINKLQGDK